MFAFKITQFRLTDGRNFKVLADSRDVTIKLGYGQTHEQSIVAQKLFIHPNYRTDKNEFDVSLVKVEKKKKLSIYKIENSIFF